jgi:hypothetical protein
MRTERTLEEEWMQVLRESVSTGQRKMSQVPGTSGLLDFTLFSLGARFETYEPFNYLIFK